MFNLPAKFKKSNCSVASKLGVRTRISCTPLMVTGIDKLEVSLSFDIGNPELFSRFSRFKSDLQEGYEKAKAFPWRDENSSFVLFSMQRMGSKFFPYIFKSGDVTLMLANRDPGSRLPNCQIEIGSVSSQENAIGIYKELIEWLSSYGFTVVKETVGRVDLSVDFIDLDIRELCVNSINRWVSRARKFATYYEDWEFSGMMLGKGNLALRIYDKQLELKTNKIKKDFFLKKWNCDDKTFVTRVEFQLRREVLKEFIIPVNTVDELYYHIDTVWKYLTEDWARNTCNNVDRKNDNQNRAETSIFWKMVQDINFILPVENTLKNRRYKQNLHKDVRQLLEQARGCLLSVVASVGHTYDDYFGIITSVRDMIAEEFAIYMSDDHQKFKERYQCRLTECYIGF